MFDFEKLEVYKKAKEYNLSVYNFLQQKKNIDNSIRNQLSRAALSIMLNIAEGTGKRTELEKRRFYVIARASVFENVAIMDLLNGLEVLTEEQHKHYYNFLEEISKMLYGMIKSLS